MIAGQTRGIEKRHWPAAHPREDGAEPTRRRSGPRCRRVTAVARAGLDIALRVVAVNVRKADMIDLNLWCPLYPPKADISPRIQRVRVGPAADISVMHEH
jgi:hypothetical protein